MSSSTPKFKSKDFRQALEVIKGIFDAHSLGIVLLDALERRASEQIFSKNVKGARGARLSNLPKMELIGQITGWFFSSDQVAYQVIKEMDRACQKERHIVESIPEDQAPQRVGSYRAIALKRERAKFVWALARDERATVQKLANRIINEFFREVADMEGAKNIVLGEAPGDEVQLAKRLQEQAERLSEATVEVTNLQSKLNQFEEERARLLAEIGSKEHMLKKAKSARQGLEGRVDELRSALADVDIRQLEAEEAHEREQAARSQVDDLATKVRRLEKLSSASEALTGKQGELEASKRELDEVRRVMRRMEQDHKRELFSRDKERTRMSAEIEEQREALRRARKQLAEQLQPAQHVERDPDAASKTLILLDQANLAAAAHALHKRKVNFAALLDELKAGRQLHRAVAFIVDNGGAGFDNFCAILKLAGWELRTKRPKRFSDGRSKADWDMGIAIEAIEAADQVGQTIIVSGDGDFAPLVRHLKRTGQTVSVAAFDNALAGELVNAADHVLRLDRSTLES